MAIKSKKIDKEYQLSDSEVNCYGFRLLTAGYQKAEYEKNPIGYHMHDRPAGTLVRWENLRVEGDKIMGTPVVNLSNPRGEQTVDEIDSGFLNAASVGHIVALEISDDPALKLPNQTGPTVTKWYNRECSLVDIPGNFNALTNLFDKDNNPLNLADFSKQIQPMSKTILFTATNLAALNITAAAPEEADVQRAFSDLVAKAAKADTLQTELANLKALTADKEVDSMLDAKLSAKQMTKALADIFRVQYKGKPEELKTVLAALPAHTLITDVIIPEHDKELQDLLAKNWNDIYKDGTVENLKNNKPEYYKAVFKKRFGHEPGVKA